MVIAVMTILGISILNISLSQTMQASNEDKKIQAYYLARSGAEATLSRFEDSAVVIKPIGTCNPVFLNNLNQFVNVQPLNMIGKFVVTVTNPNSLTTIIVSVGTVGNVKQTVTVTRGKGTTIINLPPSGSVTGESLLWYDYNSGQINTGVNTEGPPGIAVTLKAKNGKGLKIPNKNSPSATFKAEQMRFISGTQILHNEIILFSKLIAFDDPIDFSNNGNGKGALVLKVLPGGVTPSYSTFTGEVGIVFFESVGYYFKDGVKLKKSSDIQSEVAGHRLELILPTDPNFINPFSTIPTQTIISYTNTWS